MLPKGLLNFEIKQTDDLNEVLREPLNQATEEPNTQSKCFYLSRVRGARRMFAVTVVGSARREAQQQGQASEGGGRPGGATGGDLVDTLRLPPAPCICAQPGSGKGMARPASHGSNETFREWSAWVSKKSKV